MTFASSTSLVKIAFFLSICALALTIVGVFSPNWMTFSMIDVRIGLFYTCSAAGCSSGGSDAKTVPDWLKAMVAMEIVGMLLAVPSFTFLTLYIFCNSTCGKKWTRMLTLCLALGAALCILLGVIICSTKKNELVPSVIMTVDLGWSFALTVVGALVYLSVGVVLLMDVFL